MKPGRVLSHVLLLLAALLTLLSVWVWSVNQDDLGQPDASTASPAARRRDAIRQKTQNLTSNQPLARIQTAQAAISSGVIMNAKVVSHHSHPDLRSRFHGPEIT